MSYQITLSKDNTTFVADKEQTILQAAIDAGVRLPYGCNNGLCFGCLQDIDAGDTTYREPMNDVGDLLKYQTMLCKAYAESDVVLACGALPDLSLDEAVPTSSLSSNTQRDEEREDHNPDSVQSSLQTSVSNIQRRYVSATNSEIFPVKVIANEQLCEDTRRVDLALPNHVVFDFIAGQYLDVVLDNGKRRSFSIADYNADKHVISLLVKRIENGFFTGYVFDYLTDNSIWTIEAPLGHFTLRDNPRAMLMLGGSSGIAPLLAMLNALHVQNDSRTVHLYWGQQTPEQLYLHDELSELVKHHPNLHYTPVLSRATSDNWDGQHGYVQEVAIADLGDLADYDIYISGSERLVNAATTACLAAGASTSAVYLDVFGFQSAAGS